MINRILRSYRIAVVFVVLSVVCLVIYSQVNSGKALSFYVALAFLSASYLMCIYVNFLLMKIKKIMPSNIVIWVLGSLVFFPLGYFVMMSLLGGTIQEVENETKEYV